MAATAAGTKSCAAAVFGGRGSVMDADPETGGGGWGREKSPERTLSQNSSRHSSRDDYTQKLRVVFFSGSILKNRVKQLGSND